MASCDGFAFAAETLVGRAKGARRQDLFDQAVRASSQLAAGTAMLLTLMLFTLSPLTIAGLTDLSEVRASAARYLPYAAVYVVLSVAAFQLDGNFYRRYRHPRYARCVAISSRGVPGGVVAVEQLGRQSWIVDSFYPLCHCPGCGIDTTLPGVAARSGLGPHPITLGIYQLDFQATPAAPHSYLDRRRD